MQFNTANNIILLGLLPLVVNLIPNAEINPTFNNNLFGSRQVLENLELNNSYLFSQEQNAPKSEVGETRRDKERGSGRIKFAPINNT